MRITCSAVVALLVLTQFGAAEKPQYQYKDILIPQASAKEAKRDSVSFELAEKYLADGALAWSKQRACVSCHTNGTYMHIRPSLTDHLGPPSESIRRFFLKDLRSLKRLDKKKQLAGTIPTRIAYVAAGLAEWDANVSKKLATETEDAIALMLSVQAKDGSWGNLDCWPPHESSAYHGATVAAMALATAPGWLEKKKQPEEQKQIDRLKKYLQTTAPPHDYARALLLWTSTRYKGLLSTDKQAELLANLSKHQREDGGWSIRTFSTPEKWGGGNRAAKLRGEPDFGKPESDGHMTGLALMIMHAMGKTDKDPAVQRGLKWLKSNQRESGRWWTRSLNTDTFHFITYSATMYSVAALKQFGN